MFTGHRLLRVRLQRTARYYTQVSLHKSLTKIVWYQPSVTNEQFLFAFFLLVWAGVGAGARAGAHEAKSKGIHVFDCLKYFKFFDDCT